MQLPSPLVLTNDDGIDAPGIRALHALVGGVIIAPSRQHSACSHRVTLDTPVRVERRSESEFAVHGTPADCARLASLLLGQPPRLLLSGINEGANVGHDVFLSGTVAAAREATALGIPALSISQYRKGLKEVDWARTQVMTRQALEAVLERGHPSPGFWNINLPHPNGLDTRPELVFCARCTRPLPLDFQLQDDAYLHDGEKYHARDRTPGSDVDVCFGGAIAASWIPL
jgi:5'-nucleotidase